MAGVCEAGAGCFVPKSWRQNPSELTRKDWVNKVESNGF